MEAQNSQIRRTALFSIQGLLEQVLAGAGNPAELPDHLVNLCRRAAKAEHAWLLQCLQNYGQSGHRLIASTTGGSSRLPEAKNIIKLADLAHLSKKSQLWLPADGTSRGDLLRHLHCGPTLVVPLQTGNLRNGVLFLGYPAETPELTEMADAFNMISASLAAGLHNAMLAMKQ